MNESNVQKRLLYEEIANHLAQLIRQGTFRPGQRIPSVRQMSQQQGVSISTVLQAYLLLEDRELIEARPQSGYYVRSRLPSALPEPEMSAPAADPSRVSLNELVMMVLRDALNPKLVQLGAALPNNNLLPTEKLNRIFYSLSKKLGDRSNLYMFPPGSEELRLQIAHRMVAAGCSLSPSDIVITSGCVEAVDLCLQAVCRRGDIVAIESPMYFGVLQTLEALGLQALEIPTHPREGLSLEALRFALEHSPVRAVLAISNFNNPLGSSIPDENKKELVSLLAKYEIPLIEDDISGEIFFGEKRPTVAKSYDRKGLVMLCSSFSKDICPGYRVGWTAPGKFTSTVEWLKFAVSVASGTLQQLAVAEFLENGGYDRHLRRIRREYARNVGLMSQAVMRYFPEGTRVTRPTGGFVLWVQLPETIDSLDLYKLALKGGITLSPGYIFSPTKQFRNFIRLNAADWSYEIESALERLGDMITELRRV